MSLFICFIPTETEAQYRKKPKSSKSKSKKSKTSKDKYFDETGGTLKSRLWYGGNVDLFFNPGVFQIGLLTNTGYKISDRFSIGPHIGYTFQNAKSTNQRQTINQLKLGAFSRFKINNLFFVHGEMVYERNSISLTTFNIDLRQKQSFSNIIPRAGIGYNISTGLFGFEILMLFEFAGFAETDPLQAMSLNNNRKSLLFRPGINYNF